MQAPAKTAAAQTEARRPLLSNGITLIELVVAMTMSVLVLAVAVGSWIYVVRHIERKRHLSGLEVERDALLRSIVMQLRRSKEVLAWDQGSITFISELNDDTVTYSFDGEHLIRNGAIVSLASHSGRISCFSITNATSRDAFESTSSEFVLLSLTLGTIDKQGDSTAVTMLVSVRPSRDSGRSRE